MFLGFRGCLLSLFSLVFLNGFSNPVKLNRGQNPIVSFIDAIENLPIFVPTNQTDTARQKPDLYFECHLRRLAGTRPLILITIPM